MLYCYYIIICCKNLIFQQKIISWKCLLRSSKNAFIMQSKSTFLEFLRGIHRYKFGHPKKFFRGEIIQGEWRNFHRARALFLTGVEFHVLPCVLVFFLVACENSRPSSLPARVAFRPSRETPLWAGSEEGRLFSQAIFLVEFDLLFAFSVLSLDCASLFIYVHEHDRLCFPMSTEETAVFDCICWLSSSRNRKGQSLHPVEYCLESTEEYSEHDP